MWEIGVEVKGGTRVRVSKDTEDFDEIPELGETFRRRHDLAKALLTVKRAAELLADPADLAAEERQEVAAELAKAHAVLAGAFRDQGQASPHAP